MSITRSPIPPLLYAPATSGAAVANTLVETPMQPGVTIPANGLHVGQALRLAARGIYSTFTSGNLTFRIKFGATVLAAAGPVPPAASLVNRMWVLLADIVIVSIGASGTIECQGDIQLNDSSTHGVQWALVNTAAIAADTTAASLLTLTAQWDVANAANAIQCRTMLIEARN